MAMTEYFHQRKPRLSKKVSISENRFAIQNDQASSSFFVCVVAISFGKQVFFLHFQG
jgi:hypothetical protein